MKYKSIVLVLLLLSILIIPVTAHTVGNGGSAWAGNSSLENASTNLASHVIVTNFIFQDDFESVLFNNRTNLTIPTYDGSGQAIHPDIYYNATGWNGYKYWMVMTPFPASKDSFENPSVVVSNNGCDWEVPSGLTNPIDPKPPSQYNSDPDFAFKNNTLYVYYREVSGGYDKLKMKNSTDGINWSNEYASLELPNYELLSPTVVYNASDDKFYMWYVDSGNVGYPATKTWLRLRNSTDGINWSNAQTVPISFPNRVMWHVNVDYVPELNEYWMVMSAGTTKAKTSGELFFAFSTDKLNWTVLPGKIIGIGSYWDNSQIYRSAIQYINSTAKIWYSAINATCVWGTGFAETSLIDLKKDYHWIYLSKIHNKGYFNRSSSQVKTGQFSANLGFDGLAGQDVDVRRKVSDGQDICFEIDLYDDGITPGMKLFRVVNTNDKAVGIGVWSDASEVNYSYHTKAWAYTVTSIPRTVGWHRFRIFIQGDKSVEYYIDDIKVGTSSSQFNDPIYAQLSGRGYTSNFYVDDLKVYKYTSGNLTTWYDAGNGRETYQIDVNATTPANTNYTVWYRQNGTDDFVQVGGVYTDSNTIALDPRYQNTDVQIVLNGDLTATPELISITFYTKTVGTDLPYISSWGNNKTNDNSLTLTINTSEPVKFNATANQIIETWKWYKDNVYQPNNFDNYAAGFSSGGAHTIRVKATNENGTSNTIIWSVTVKDHHIHTVGKGGCAWIGNSTMNNVTEDKGDYNVKIGIFADNFEDNNLNCWTTNGGRHTLSNGVYKQQATAKGWITARPTSFTYASPAVIVAKVKVTDGGAYLDEGLGWGESTWDPSNVLLAGRRDHWNQWQLRRNNVIDDNDTSSRTLNVWCDLQLYKKFDGYNYCSSYDNITLNTSNSPTCSQYPYLLGSSAIVQYWDDVRVIALNANNNIVTSGNLTSWYDAGNGKETYQIDVNATTPANTNYTVWYRQNGAVEFVQVGGVYTDSNTIALDPGYQNTDVRIVLNGDLTATPELISITFYTKPVSTGNNLSYISSWDNNKTNNNTITLTINTHESVKFNASAKQAIDTGNWYKDSVYPTNNFDNFTEDFRSVEPHTMPVNATNENCTSNTITGSVAVQDAHAAAPNITSFAPQIPVNDTVGNWETFNVSVNQTMNQTWYLNRTTQVPKNESVTTANFTSHADVVYLYNVSAVAENKKLQQVQELRQWI